MPVKKRNELYDLFATGNKPTHDDFVDLIDSAINIAEDGIGVSEKGKPMEIIQQGEKRRLLDFSSSKDTPIWRISALSSEGLRSGLNVASSNTSRLFIDQGNGLVGLNTDNPGARLHIVPESGITLRVDDTLKNPSLAIEAGGNIGIGTLPEEAYKVAINGKVHIQNNTTIDNSLQVKNGLAVEGAPLTASQGMTVRNGATIETGLLTAKAGITISGGLLNATAGAVVTNSALEARNGLTVQNGAQILSGKLEANAGLKVSGALLEVTTGASISGALTAQNGLTVQQGAEIQSGLLEARAGATVSGALLEASNGLTVHGPTTLYNATSIESGMLTAKGGISVTNGSFFSADGEVTLGNEETGNVAILGGLSVNKGLTVSQGLTASAGATVNGLTVTNGVTVSTGVLNANGGLSASGAVTLNPTDEVTINGDITVTDDVQIDENLNVTGALSVTGNTTLGNVNSQSLTVNTLTISGTMNMSSVESVALKSISANTATLKNLTVSTLCRTAEDVVLDSSIIYAVYQGPTNVTPKVKVQRGTFPPKVVTPPEGAPVEEPGHYMISVDDVAKIVTITYNELSDISELVEDWDDYKSKEPVKAEGFYFAQAGTSSWRPQDMEIDLFSPKIPYKEYTFTDKGLRIVYTGEKTGAPQFEIKGTNTAPPMLGFTFWFEINGLKLTITYLSSSDPATLTLNNLITDWTNWKTIGIANVGEFDIQRTSATDAPITDFSQTLTVNSSGKVSYHGMIKTKTATVVGAMRFDGFGAVINGISTRDTLAENSNALLVTQKAVKAYIDKGLLDKADLALISNNPISDNSNTLVPTQRAVKTYVGGFISNNPISDNSDTLAPTQRAVKTFVDSGLNLKADLALISNNPISDNSNTLVPTQRAVKTYVGGFISNNPITDNSDTLVPTQRTVKTFVDSGLNLKADLTLISNNPISDNSNTLVPTQRAVKTFVDSSLNLKADQALISTNPITDNSNTLVPTQRAVKTYVDSGLNLKADQTALAAKAGLQKLADLSIPTKTVHTVDDIVLSAGSRGLLMVLIRKAIDNSILVTGTFAIHGTNTVSRISGDGMTDRTDGGSYNVYYAATKLTVQNTSGDDITATVTYFGA